MIIGIIQLNGTSVDIWIVDHENMVRLESHVCTSVPSLRGVLTPCDRIVLNNVDRFDQWKLAIPEDKVIDITQFQNAEDLGIMRELSIRECMNRETMICLVFMDPKKQTIADMYRAMVLLSESTAFFTES